jgi:hypothetical protein
MTPNGEGEGPHRSVGHWRRGRTLSFSARGAKLITLHGPIQRLFKCRVNSYPDSKVRSNRSLLRHCLEYGEARGQRDPIRFVA